MVSLERKKEICWEVNRYKALGITKSCLNNSYIIKDKEKVIFDPIAVKDEKADYIVITNFLELEHIKLSKENKYIVTKFGKEVIENFGEYDYLVIGYGDEFNIGETNLKFYCTDFYITSYWLERDILLSGELFSQYEVIGNSDTKEDFRKLMEELKEYYANILLPHREDILKLLEDFKNLEIKKILPSHGVCWERYIENVFFKYKFWSLGNYRERAVIVFISLYQATELIAKTLKEGLEEEIEVRVHRLNFSKITEVMRDLLDAKYLLVGSPTINNDIHPKVKFFLDYMKKLNPS
ncbi:flavodoxin domain-containing protein, partial [Methanocaldococcus infernus]